MLGSGWRLSRGRAASAGHISLAICGVLALVIVLLGKAEASIFDGVRAKLSDWTQPILESVRDPLSGLQKWVENIGGIFSVYEENIRLKQEIADLRRWQEVAGSLQRRIARYEILLKSVPDAEFSTIQARVIGQSSRPFIKTMILNAGADQGVKSGQAVIDDRGLIGRIYLTGGHTSWVILLTDLNSHVPVTIEPSNRRAMMAGDNSTAPLLDVDSVASATAAVPHAGDRVYSSGDGGQLPPGLPVGVVVDDGAHLRVALFADPDATDYVHVVNFEVPQPDTAGLELPVTQVGPAAAQAAAQNDPNFVQNPPPPRALVPLPKPSLVVVPPRRPARPATQAHEGGRATTVASAPTPAPAPAETPQPPAEEPRGELDQ